LNFSRHRGARGFFKAKGWQNGAQMIHEISLNPDVLCRGPEESLGTLVHEMTHQWQQDHGEPPRRCYHDREWADKMQEIGLIPSNTGEPGGERVGQKVSHYIDPVGKFLRALRQMPKDCLLPWTSGGQKGEKPRQPPRARKVELTCPRCELSVWVEEDAVGHPIICEPCSTLFSAKGPGLVS
jgi:hypothetical protein